MRTPEQVKWDFVQQWLGKAQQDLRAAKVLLSGELEDFDPVGFHAQQAAEKFIKAGSKNWGSGLSIDLSIRSTPSERAFLPLMSHAHVLTLPISKRASLPGCFPGHPATYRALP